MKKSQAVQLIQELSNANGVSSFETEVVRILQHAAADFTIQRLDSIRNLYLEKKNNLSEGPAVLFDAHSDEVGFMIQIIKENSLLRLFPLGGWVLNAISAQKVRIRNREGTYLPGIVTSRPPHFMTPEERQRPLTIADLTIDIGATSKGEVIETYKIDLSAPVVPDMTYCCNEQTNLFLGKALDCRIGCTCLVDVMEELRGETLPFELVVTVTAQEGVGERGALIAVKQVNPDLAIVFEGCLADDTAETPEMIQPAMGKGPMLCYFDASMITSPGFQEYALEIAKIHKIPVQVFVRSGGGTSGMAIIQVQGAPTIVVRIPVRCAHTPHCYVDFQDYQAAKELVIQLIKNLDADKIQALVQSLLKEWNE